MTFEIAMNDSVDSLPPRFLIGMCAECYGGRLLKPFRIAAFPDFMASEAILAITSGRASNMIRSTPMGHVTLSRSSPSSRRVRRVTCPTVTDQ
jgi:hypothetical protein